MTNPLRIFDCSNSVERPPHRGGGGPRMNDVVRQLKENAPFLDLCFVESPHDAQVLFTNDVFPSSLFSLELPRVKRMDGIFSQEHLLSRNLPLNTAAQTADITLFISEFSKKSYEALYGPLPNSRVILNTADPRVFYSSKKSYKKSACLKLIAVATDWKREEKRWDDTLSFARRHLADVHLVVVGAPPEGDIPSNVELAGYLADYSALLRDVEGMLCLSYKDAAPKTVCQGLCVRLPVLYAQSGGVEELVQGAGVGIPDVNAIQVERAIPSLDPKAVDLALDRYKRDFWRFKTLLEGRDFENEFFAMLKGYAKTFYEAAER